VTSATDRRVREVFIELTDTLTADFDIIDFLDRLAARCTELLDVSACGILLVDHHGVLNLVAASTEQTRLLELSQLQNSAGPCLDAYRSGRPVHEADLHQPDRRWPPFTRAAIAAGFSAVHALPMLLRQDVIGAMNLFNTYSGQMPPVTLALGQALADAATIGIVHQRALARQELIAEQLQHALNSRTVIEQAKGFLAQRLDTTMEEAFTMLRNHARSNNLKLTAVAADVISSRLDLTRPQTPGHA
jgi:transcriptional regulator with GAF, ATPase, and Fis domain